MREGVRAIRAGWRTNQRTSERSSSVTPTDGGKAKERRRLRQRGGGKGRLLSAAANSRAAPRVGRSQTNVVFRSRHSHLAPRHIHTQTQSPFIWRSAVRERSFRSLWLWRHGGSPSTWAATRSIDFPVMLVFSQLCVLSLDRTLKGASHFSPNSQFKWNRRFVLAAFLRGNHFSPSVNTNARSVCRRGAELLGWKSYLKMRRRTYVCAPSMQKCCFARRWTCFLHGLWRCRSIFISQVSLSLCLSHTCMLHFFLPPKDAEAKLLT